MADNPLDGVLGAIALVLLLCCFVGMCLLPFAAVYWLVKP